MKVIAKTAEELAQAFTRGERITEIDIQAFDKIIEHTPEDLTVTAQTGMTLAALQTHLAARGQWLPIDPVFPDRITLWDLLKGNLSGPRRFGYGTIREHLIGLKVVLGDGRIIKSGGKVVKNVAGYDLMKLFVGDHGTLGVSVEATFKVRPLPESERFVQLRVSSHDEVARLVATILNSPLSPVVLDMHRLDKSSPVTLIVATAGTREDVEWSIAEAGKIGISEAANLSYEEQFWGAGPRTSSSAAHLSVLPSRLAAALSEINPDQFIARAGNGIIYYRSGSTPTPGNLPTNLFARVKDTFDPKHILPELKL